MWGSCRYSGTCFPKGNGNIDFPTFLILHLLSCRKRELLCDNPYNSKAEINIKHGNFYVIFSLFLSVDFVMYFVNNISDGVPKHIFTALCIAFIFSAKLQMKKNYLKFKTWAHFSLLVGFM